MARKTMREQKHAHVLRRDVNAMDAFQKGMGEGERVITGSLMREATRGEVQKLEF